METENVGIFWKLCVLVATLLSGSLASDQVPGTEFVNYQPTTTYILAKPVHYPNGSVSNETVTYYYQTAPENGEVLQDPGISGSSPVTPGASEASRPSSYPYSTYYPVAAGKAPSYYYPSYYSKASKGHSKGSTYSYPRSGNWRLQKRHEHNHRVPWSTSFYDDPHDKWRSYYSQWNKHNEELQKEEARKLKDKLKNKLKKSQKKKKKGKKSKKKELYKKWSNNRQDSSSDYDFEEAEGDDDFSILNIFDSDYYPDFLFSGLSLEDLEASADETNDLFALGGDEEDGDVLSEAGSFLSPSILSEGLSSSGLDLHSHLAEAFPGLGFEKNNKGLKRIFGAGLPFMGLPRLFALKKLGLGFKLFFAIMLLPLILLFLPIPILNSFNTTSTALPMTNSRNQDLVLGEGNPDLSRPTYFPLLEIGRQVLKAESCIERISCEIHNLNHAAGMDEENRLFTQVMNLVHNFDGLFPPILARMANGYLTRTSNSSSCVNFHCQNLKTHSAS